MAVLARCCSCRASAGVSTEKVWFSLSAYRGIHTRHIRLPWPLHGMILYASGPLLLYAMALYVDRRVYVRLLAGHFMFGLLQGAGQDLWEAFTDLILIVGAKSGLWPEPQRKLDAEYLQIRRLLDGYAELSTMREGISMSIEQAALAVTGVMSPAQKRRLQELLEHHLAGIVSLEIIAV